MQAEVESLENNNTWTFVDRPKDKNVLPGKWVYRVKYSADGQVDKYKARYAAKGFAQVEGLDFFETYAPTCNQRHSEPYQQSQFRKIYISDKWM